MEELLLTVYDDCLAIAAKYRYNNEKAAIFSAATVGEQEEIFNTEILPLWRDHDSPEPLSKNYLTFQDRLFGRPTKDSNTL